MLTLRFQRMHVLVVSSYLLERKHLAFRFCLFCPFIWSPPFPTQVLATMHTQEARRIAMRATNPALTTAHTNGYRVISPVVGQRASVATMVNPPATSNASSASSSGYSSMNGTNLPEVLAQQQLQQPQPLQGQQDQHLKLHQPNLRRQEVSPPPPPPPPPLLPQDHQVQQPSVRQSLFYHHRKEHRQSVSTNNLNGLEREFKKVCFFLLTKLLIMVVSVFITFTLSD